MRSDTHVYFIVYEPFMRGVFKATLLTHRKDRCIMSRQVIQDCVVHFIKDEDGATAIEYGLLAALISVVIGVAATAVGNQLVLVFNRIQTDLANALAS